LAIIGGVDAKDLIVIARKRAGISQRELAARLGRPQATIARWEVGAREPSYAAVQQALRACGLQQLIDLATYDESDVPLAHRQLALAPLQRLSSVARVDHAALERALRAIAAGPARAIVVGEVAGALQGSPLVVRDELVDIVAHPDDRPLAHATLAHEPVRLLERPPGTRGYRDLARGAEQLALDDERTVSVAGIQDLLRIALSDRDAVSQAIGLSATLRAQRTHTGERPQMSDDQARDAVERWLERQATHRIGA
jgi:transcriptional regulator with XRE-family HTH domain